MELNFDQYAAEGNTFMKGYADELGLAKDPEKAGRILTTILHGLRSLISTEDSLQFIAQLPMFLKAVYVNDWAIKTEKEEVKNMDDFIGLLRSISGVAALNDFETDGIVENDIYSTFYMLKQLIKSLD